jgi:hypothetical protein
MNNFFIKYLIFSQEIALPSLSDIVFFLCEIT